MLLLGIPTKQKAFVLLFARLLNLFDVLGKKKKSAVQPEKQKRERE